MWRRTLSRCYQELLLYILSVGSLEGNACKPEGEEQGEGRKLREVQFIELRENIM